MNVTIHNKSTTESSNRVSSASHSINEAKNKKGYLKLAGTFLVFIWIHSCATLPALAQDNLPYDEVNINGRVLNFIEKIVVERFLGRDLPNGKYWLETDTGVWGHVGGPAKGKLFIPPEYRKYVEKEKTPSTESRPQAKITAVTAGADGGYSIDGMY